MSKPIRLFVFGLGYTGWRFAHSMVGRAEWVGGTVRSIERAVALAAEPAVRPFVFDGQSAGVGVAEAVKAATHVVISIPPGEADPVLALHRETLMAARDLRWLGYLSTVGVYGNWGGAWVSEATTPHPASERARQRIVAEKAWAGLAAERSFPLATFRIAGIYGPGRNPFVKLADGTAHRIVKPGQVFNRIHVDDIVAVLTAASASEASGIFNVSDDLPAPPQDVVAYAAEISGMTPPPEVPFAAADLSPMARSFYADNKRVKNDRIRSGLGVDLAYPDYRTALPRIWRDGTWR